MAPVQAQVPNKETPWHPSAATDRQQLVEKFDALFRLQDATARGYRSAVTAQKALLVDIGQRLQRGTSIEPSRLVPYIVGYVLSGGDPTTAAIIDESQGLQPADRLLLQGVSLFMQGDRDGASKFLKTIDVKSLPLRISGRVALAQAILENDPAARQFKLSVASGLMPGTLVEESALRRSALSFAETAQPAQLWSRLERYQRRFPNSVYAPAFWEEILEELIRWRTEVITPQLDRLDLVLQELDPSRRRDVYMHLAHISLIGGNMGLVQYGGGRALRLALEGSVEEQTAKLYLLLHSIAFGQVDNVPNGLNAIRRHLLAEDDKALLDAGRWIAQQINRPLSAGPQLGSSEELKAVPLRVRADELLVDIEKVLMESKS